MSIAKGTPIFVYSLDKSSLINTFTSAKKAREFFKTDHCVILNHARNGLIFKGKWFLSTSLISKV